MISHLYILYYIAYFTNYYIIINIYIIKKNYNKYHSVLEININP